MKPFLLGCSLFLMIQVGYSQQEERPDIQEIKRIRALTNQALHAHDIGKETIHYTDQYTIATSSGVKITGKAAYIERYGNDSTGMYTRTPREIRISPNDTVAYETGVWDAKQPGKSFGGNYTAQWVKKEHTWKVQSEIYILLWTEE